MKKFLVLLTSVSLLALAGCDADEPAAPSEQNGELTGSDKLTTDGWIKLAVPEGWSEVTDEGQENWSVAGWSTIWQNDAAESQVLLVNGEYGEHGALQAVGVLGSDPQFGGIPSYRSQGEVWLNENESANPAIRRLDFLYGADEEGSGVMWLVEDRSDRRTGAVVLKGENLDAGTIADLEESLQLAD